METLTANKAKTTKFDLASIDETTQWRNDIAKACGKIMTVYFYDKNQHTYCAELAPSYTLIPLYCFAENDISDEMKDELHEGEMSNEPIYVHVSQVDKMKTQKAPANLNGRYYASEGKKYRELMEFAEEYLRGNHQL